MKNVRFGKTNLQVSVLGFGSAPAAYLSAERDAAAKMVNAMLDAGINLIDTAASYPGSEAFLGEAVGHRRSEFTIVSKIAPKIAGVDAEPWSEKSVTLQVDRSLANLKTDVVDVMLLHTCPLNVLEKSEALGALVRAREAGKIRFAGFSGDNDAAAYAVFLPDIAVLETSINIVDQRNITAVLPACETNDIGVLAKRPIANAAWKDLASQPGMYKTYARTYTERLAAMKLSADTLGFTGPEGWPELALRFTLSHPAIHSAIVGTTSPTNLALNLQAAAAGPLAPEELTAIYDSFRQADPDGKWLGQT